MSDPAAQPARHGIAPWQFGALLGFLIFAAFPQVICGLESFVARDFGFFAYPLAAFQKECFWRGDLPFWDPYNNCGVPFLAQWNTMPLYPPSFLYLAFPLEWSLSAFCLLHLWFAGWGMFFLARRWTGQSWAAAFAGTAFAFNGFTLNLLMWPSHIATFAWLPWVVLCAEAAWRDGGKKILTAAFVGALQMFAGGPETIALTWLIVSALWMQQLLTAETSRLDVCWRYPVVLALVFTLSAVQLLPFLDLVAHAQRQGGYTDLRWSMPASGLANFLVPMAFGSTATEGIFFQHGQYWTSSYYTGLGALWLAALSFLGLTESWQKIRGPQFVRPLSAKGVSRWQTFCREKTLLLVIVATLSLLCALGESTPFYPLLRHLLPPLSLITYPIKFVLVLIFAVPLLAAFALADLGQHRQRLVPVGGILLALIAGITVWTRLVPDDAPGSGLNGITRLAILIVTGAVLTFQARGTSFRFAGLLPLLFIVIAWLDVFTHEPRQNPTTRPDVFAPDLARTRLAMAPQPDWGGSRAMLSPAAALELTRFGVSDPRNNFLAKRLGYCANANLLDRVPKVDGFFSLAPREFDRLLSTVYAAPNTNWAGLEDFLGVSQWSSPTNPLAWQPRSSYLPIISAGQQPVFLPDTSAISFLAQSNFNSAATVILPPEAKSLVTATNSTSAQILAPHFELDSVDFDVTTPRPVLAVVAQTWYHAWHAEVDGRPQPLLRANVAFQAVQVSAGKHHIHLGYEDRLFDIGAALSLCMWLNCLISYAAFRRRELPAVTTYEG